MRVENYGEKMAWELSGNDKMVCIKCQDLINLREGDNLPIWSLPWPILHYAKMQELWAPLQRVIEVVRVMWREMIVSRSVGHCRCRTTTELDRRIYHGLTKFG
jgi:hypothetical protein